LDKGKDKMRKIQNCVLYFKAVSKMSKLLSACLEHLQQMVRHGHTDGRGAIVKSQNHKSTIYALHKIKRDKSAAGHNCVGAGPSK
jgi:hypothetical protein